MFLLIIKPIKKLILKYLKKHVKTRHEVISRLDFSKQRIDYYMHLPSIFKGS